MATKTTLGRLLVRAALPLKYKSRADAPFTADYIQKLTTELAKLNPDLYIDILQRLNHIGLRVVSAYGRLAGLTVDDIGAGTDIRNKVKQFNALIDSILNDAKLTNAQKLQKIILLGYKYSDKIKDAVVADHKARNTALYNQMQSKARGNPMQLTQLNFGDLGVRDALNRDIPYFAASPRASGASPFACWVGASSSRKGFYDVQAMTGRAGYLGKQASNATHNVPIIELDCGTLDTGLAVKADNDAIGSVLLRSIGKYPAGTIVTEQMLLTIDDDALLIVRSPMACKSKHGVCAKCSGLNENGKFSSIGLYVALNASKTFIEKATQAGVGSKHVGGTGGKMNLNPLGLDQPTGMDALLRLFYVPSTFRGAAVLAPVDGKVNDIRKAPQGGHYITVGAVTTYAPQARTVRVKVGDLMTAGDKLTNGIPNPSAVVLYKGLGLGRRYFLELLNRTLKLNKWGVNKRNLLQFSRSFLDNVLITDPDGVGQYLPGDVVNYSALQKDWLPRLGTILMLTGKARNLYLLMPALHYTIGTRITPAVQKDLKAHGFDKIHVNAKLPPFKAKFVRSQSLMLNDLNWLPRMMGLRLQQSLFDAAQKGITDRYDSPSYIDKVVASPYKPQG